MTQTQIRQSLHLVDPSGYTYKFLWCMSLPKHLSFKLHTASLQSHIFQTKLGVQDSSKLHAEEFKENILNGCCPAFQWTEIVWGIYWHCDKRIIILIIKEAAYHFIWTYIQVAYFLVGLCQCRTKIQTLTRNHFTDPKNYQSQNWHLVSKRSTQMCLSSHPC